MLLLATVYLSVCASRLSPKPHSSSAIFVSAFYMYLFLPGTVSQSHCLGHRQGEQVRGLDMTVKDILPRYDIMQDTEGSTPSLVPIMCFQKPQGEALLQCVS